MRASQDVLAEALHAVGRVTYRVVPLDIKLHAAAILAALAARGYVLVPDAGIREAAEKAVHLLGNYLWNEDGEDEEWLIEAHDGLRDALSGAATEPADGLRTLDYGSDLDGYEPSGTHADAYVDGWNAALAALRALPAEPQPPIDAGTRAALEGMATRWEHEAGVRVSDPKASGASLLAAGIQRSHAMSVRAVLSSLPAATEPADGLDEAQLRAALEAMWPHHTEGVGSSPPSPGDHSYEVWEPFLPGSPDSVAVALAARLRSEPPDPAAPPGEAT